MQSCGCYPGRLAPKTVWRPSSMIWVRAAWPTSAWALLGYQTTEGNTKLFCGGCAVGTNRNLPDQFQRLGEQLVHQWRAVLRVVGFRVAGIGTLEHGIRIVDTDA